MLILPIGLNETARKFYLQLTVAVLAANAPAAALGYETDQFSNRNEPIEDSTEALNHKVNETLEEIVSEWRQGQDEMAFVDAIYRKIGGLHWVDRLERWAMKSPDVDKLDTKRYDSVFSGHPIWAIRVISIFGVGKTIRVNDQLIGSDKIGHFISQGRKFYRRFLRSGSEEKAAQQSAYTERAIFGRMTTGAYSNADLVANYEGHRFYRSLFEDDIIAGKPAILSWQDDRWIIQRKFDWADHVNEYWDEALNINKFDASLYKHMHATFVAMCPQYWAAPELYRIVDEDALKARYTHLGLNDASELRLDSLCPVQAYLEKES
ncbi:MAG: hypothetical protein OEU90_04695, partial [Gammaproteobacteria bacterium]|nr:hypothetical protein [Gammaproteobacteria bacterium]